MRPDTRTSLAVLVTTCLLAGCGVSVTSTQRSAEPVPARPAGCQVQVVNGRPAQDWDVIGVLDLASFSVQALPRDDEAFLDVVRSAVCKAGGDAVIAGVTGDGRYVLATVLKWKPEAPAEPAPATCTAGAEDDDVIPAPPPAPPAAPLPAPPPAPPAEPLPAPPPAPPVEPLPVPPLAPPIPEAGATGTCPGGESC